MKHIAERLFYTPPSVAPYTGAWIETDNKADHRLGLCVAPYTGAWIETMTMSLSSGMSHVAPYTGAWIET